MKDKELVDYSIKWFRTCAEYAKTCYEFLEKNREEREDN